MGQKINPLGFRLNKIKNCSLWFESFNQYSFLLKNDNQLLTILKTKIEEFGINKIRIKRNLTRTALVIHVHTQYPHLLLSKTEINFIRYKNQKNFT